MSRISVYTTTTNAIKNEYFVMEGIKSALLFADEVVVVDGGSSDNTIEQIRNINDSRIKIYTNKWLHSLGKCMTGINKSLALGYCTGDWCILMDSDEVYHEDDAEAIKRLPDVVGDDIIGIEFNTIHFYKDYKHVLNGCPDWKDLYNHKVYMVRNGLCIHHGAINTEPDGHVDLHGRPIDMSNVVLAKIRVFHYGHARSKEAYVKKLNHIEGRHSGWEWKPMNAKDFEWVSDDKLLSYNESHPSVMNDRIGAGSDHDRVMELYNYTEGESDAEKGIQENTQA